MSDKTQEQINDLRQTLETIHANHADFAQTVRKRLHQAVEMIDHGHSDRARDLLHTEAEALGESWAAGDAGGSA